MSAPTPWLVVSHRLDTSPAAASVDHLVTWLSRRSDIALHTAAWAAGPGDRTALRRGRFADVAACHEGVLPAGLRRVGLAKVAGGVAGRAVRRALRSVPSEGVLFLNTGFASPVLRYLPTGRRTVVTHLHQLDRLADPPLPEARVAALVAATDHWLAADEETRAWAGAAWGLDVDSILVAPEMVEADAMSLEVEAPAADPSRLRLAIAGAAWFRRDLASRLVQALLRARPALDLDLVWCHVVAEHHLAPLLHDLDRLGVVDRFRAPATPGEVPKLMEGIDALALTTLDEDAPWAAWEAALTGAVVASFDVHPRAGMVEERGGVTCSYPDVSAMAEALLAAHDDRLHRTAESVASARRELARRDVAAIGPQILDLVSTRSEA